MPFLGDSAKMHENSGAIIDALKDIKNGTEKCRQIFADSLEILERLNKENGLLSAELRKANEKIVELERLAEPDVILAVKVLCAFLGVTEEQFLANQNFVWERKLKEKIQAK